MAEPRWLAEARRYVGQREIQGRKHNPTILKWWTAIRAPFTDDETPWCAAFVGGVLEACDIKSSRSAAARSYLKWGKKLANPSVGCIVVFERGPNHGHVGFLVSKDARNNLLILGGNQGDAVNVRAFPQSRVLGYRWPDSEPYPTDYLVPKTKQAEEVSSRESLLSMPDDPGVEEAPEQKGFMGKVMAWVTGGGLGTAGIFSSFSDWKVAAVVVGGFLVAGLLGAAIYFFATRKRR